MAMAMAISHQSKGHEFVNILPSLGVISRVRVRASVILPSSMAQLLYRGAG